MRSQQPPSKSQRLAAAVYGGLVGGVFGSLLMVAVVLSLPSNANVLMPHWAFALLVTFGLIPLGAAVGWGQSTRFGELVRRLAELLLVRFEKG